MMPRRAVHHVFLVALLGGSVSVGATAVPLSIGSGASAARNSSMTVGSPAGDLASRAESLPAELSVSLPELQAVAIVAPQAIPSPLTENTPASAGGSALAFLSFFGLLVLSGVGSPIGEDAVLLSAGHLSSGSLLSWGLLVVLGVAGVVGSDLLLFGFGRRAARGAQVLPPSGPAGRLARLAASWLARFGDAAIVLARLVPGTRTMVFVAAGLRGMSPRRFLTLDTMAACLWVPLVLAIGSGVIAQAWRAPVDPSPWLAALAGGAAACAVGLGFSRVCRSQARRLAASRRSLPQTERASIP